MATEMSLAKPHLSVGSKRECLKHSPCFCPPNVISDNPARSTASWRFRNAPPLLDGQAHGACSETAITINPLVDNLGFVFGAFRKPYRTNAADSTRPNSWKFQISSEIKTSAISGGQRPSATLQKVSRRKSENSTT
jgi:hypothetical protein